MRTRLVAVIGDGRALSADEAKLPEALGAGLVRAGFGIVCGGLGGVMEAVCRGAARARGEARWPPLVGVVPSYDADSGNEYLDVVLPTGMGHARNALVAAGGEVVVCVGGATGALSEVGLARKIGRPVVALPGSGGTAALVTKAIASVIPVATVDEAVAKVRSLLA